MVEINLEMSKVKSRQISYSFSMKICKELFRSRNSSVFDMAALSSDNLPALLFIVLSVIWGIYYGYLLSSQPFKYVVNEPDTDNRLVSIS